MAAQAARFERVEWLYDGLRGKIVPWTKENGGTSDDPSVLCFAVGHDGKVIEMCPPAEAYQPKAFTAWLRRHADAWERSHPRTKVPFAPGEVVVAGEGADRKASCAALDGAVAAKRPALLYFAREAADGKVRGEMAEAAACRKFEKETLGSARAAGEAKGWTLLRFDVSAEGGRLLAAQCDVVEVPALVMVVPGVEAPILLDRRTTPAALAILLKKYRTP